MIPQTSEPVTVGPMLQTFFSEHLISHRLASRQTVDGYTSNSVGEKDAIPGLARS
jgi:hypothetical protein